MDIQLKHPGSTKLQLNSTSWYDGEKSVFFLVYEGGLYCTTISFEPDEARDFAQKLIEAAEHIEKVGFKKK